jgi:UDP-glucuronate 4-epimerase
MDYVTSHQSYEICNLGEAKTVSLMQMIRTIELVSGKTAHLDYQPMQPGDVLYTCADISHSKALLGYKPSFEFEAGIRKFISWFEQNL